MSGACSPVTSPWISRSDRSTGADVLLTLGLLLGLSACEGEVTSTPTPTPAGEPTPTPGPNIDHQTWFAFFYEVDDPDVYAETAFYFGTEHQNGTELVAYLFHIGGPLIIDGLEVPDDQAIRMTGTYLWERQIDVSVVYYGHLLRAQFKVQPDEVYMEGTVSIDGDAYQEPLIFAACDYIKILDDE